MTGAGTQETWAIGEVAAMAGVSTRTLRHYESLALLRPVGSTSGGHRVYDRAGVERLQQILVLRELGVPLGQIGHVLDGSKTRTEVLRDHHARLVAERDRLDAVAQTVAATIRSIEGGRTMPAADLFAGFDHTEHEPEARERYGDAAVDRGNSAWERLGARGQADHKRENAAIADDLAAAMAAGKAPGDEEVQALVERHYQQVCVFWTPDADAFAGLGQMYVDDPRFAATYEALAPGLAAFLRDAMAVYAGAKLAG